MRRNSFWCVKSLITILMVITFCYLTIFDSQTYAETFKNLIVTVVSFYFGTQWEKKKGEDLNERN